MENKKLFNRDDAVHQVRQWQSEGLKIGFTNGCFDLLHPGHVTLLEEAASRCDKLVMGLNTDGSVRRYKGPTRPVQSELNRAKVLSGLTAIDMIVLFDEDTPEALIAMLKPDIHFKGGDYTVDQLPEAKVVLSYGGDVQIINFLDGHSTTSLIEKSKT